MNTTTTNQAYRRVSVALPPELDQAVLALRKTDKYCRCSYGEIVRTLISEGAKTLAGKG